MRFVDEALEPRAAEVREDAGEVLIQPLSASLSGYAVRADRTGYQIFDLMCPFERTTMSTMARSKKLVVLKTSGLTRLL